MPWLLSSEVEDLNVERTTNAKDDGLGEREAGELLRVGCAKLTAKPSAEVELKAGRERTIRVLEKRGKGIKQDIGRITVRTSVVWSQRVDRENMGERELLVKLRA